MSSLTKYLNPEIVAEVQRLDLRARFIVEGFLAGLHRSPFQGLSVEFAEHRKYTAGDDPRTIDWNVFARTDRFFVRKYAAETHLACHLIVDASASMGYVGPASRAHSHSSAMTKLTYAIHIAAALGYLLTKQQDAISLGIIGENLATFLPPRSRRSDLSNLLGTLASAKPQGVTALAEGIRSIMSRVPHRGVVVVLSDLLTDADDVAQALRHIRFRGHDLIVMHILDATEANFGLDGALRLADPESSLEIEVDADGVRAEYHEALRTWRDELRTQISMLRGDYVALDTSMAFNKALVEFLSQRSRRR